MTIQSAKALADLYIIDTKIGQLVEDTKELDIGGLIFVRRGIEGEPEILVRMTGEPIELLKMLGAGLNALAELVSERSHH
jgi:hypothetical protein